MSFADLIRRGPYRVRLGTQAIVEDRHGDSAFVVVEPINDPRARIREAQAWVDLANAASEADRARPFVQAAE